MRRVREVKGFTLVELLVVIGIIALLISILLPALNKARQQSNLIYCQSNLRQMGQACQIYSSENHGYYPPMVDGLLYYTYADVLSLLSERPAGADPTGWGKGSGQYMPTQELGIFRDVDMPNLPFDDHGTSYMVNPRIFGAVDQAAFGGGFLYDPVVFAQNQYAWPQVHVSSIRHSSEVAAAWCGPIDIAIPNTNYGIYHVFSPALDNYAFYNFHSFMNPPPPKNIGAFKPAFYFNPVSLGAPLPGYGTPSSAVQGSVLPAYLKAANQEYYADANAMGHPTFSGPGGSDTCNMRFRHMSDTEANFLFLDGHVESKLIGSVLAKDLCVSTTN